VEEVGRALRLCVIGFFRTSSRVVVKEAPALAASMPDLTAAAQDLMSHAPLRAGLLTSEYTAVAALYCLQITDVTGVAAAVRRAVAGAAEDSSPSEGPSEGRSPEGGSGGGCDALVVVDSTWLTPVLMRPLELGADFVVNSAQSQRS